MPAPTQKEVEPSDIAGMWEYPADYEKTIVTLELREDGTFAQTIKRKGQEPQIHTGEWKLDGKWPKLSVLKPVSEGSGKPWIVEEAQWWVVDSHQEGVDFAIFGAADDRDPDNCHEFKKIQ